MSAYEHRKPLPLMALKLISSDLVKEKLRHLDFILVIAFILNRLYSLERKAISFFFCILYHHSAYFTFIIINTTKPVGCLHTLVCKKLLTCLKIVIRPNNHTRRANNEKAASLPYFIFLTMEAASADTRELLSSRSYCEARVFQYTYFTKLKYYCERGT